jgi:hypothetical protein
VTCTHNQSERETACSTICPLCQAEHLVEALRLFRLCFRHIKRYKDGSNDGIINGIYEFIKQLEGGTKHARPSIE